MAASIRHRLSPIAGVVTLAIGIALVATVQFVSLIFVTPKVAVQSESADRSLVSRHGDNTDPVAPLKMELSCYDPHILPIWHELKNDNSFRERLRMSSGLVDCAEILEVKRTDLNRDGTDEFLARGKGPLLCVDGIGNCNYWIFEQKSGVARKLLASAHNADAHELGIDEVQKTRTRGYADILLTGYDGQHVLHFHTFRFDGSEYLESRCMSEVPRLLRDGAGSWELITCDDFYIRRDEMREGVEELLRTAN